ncbi:MAG: CHC2 zinc finger domain-containing protein [Anaerotruncus massiliensis (ex Togo et al. 2019)]
MNQNDRLLDELRGYLPEYMAQKRMVVGRGKKLIRCINPQHSDSTPSMSYYPKTKKLHCFGCGATYDLFDVIRMDYPDCDSFPRQVKKACELFGVPFPEDFADPAASRRPARGRAPPPPRGRAPAAPEEPPNRPPTTARWWRRGCANTAGRGVFRGAGHPAAALRKYSSGRTGSAPGCR